MNRTVQLQSALAVAAIALFVGFQTVFAHTGYDRSVPAQDEVLADAPERVEAFFTHEVVKREGAFHVRVFDETGVQVSEGDGVVNDDDRRNINVELPTTLGSGRYLVDWTVTSDVDGATSGGFFCFYVGVGPMAGDEEECVGEHEHEPATSTMAAADDPDDDDSNAVLISGIVVAVFAVLVAGGGGIFWLGRRD